MKRLFFITAFCMIQFYTTGQTAIDSVKADIQKLNKKIDTANKKIDSIKMKPVKDTVKIPINTAECQKCTDVPVSGFFSWLLVFLPALIFLILLGVILSYGLKNFNLNGAMSESDYPKITILNPEYNTLNLTNATLTNNDNLSEILPPTIDISNAPAVGQAAPPAPSISRYIAFITSMLTLVVALCMSCFFIYYYVRTGCAPDLSALSTILIALGVGVLPYVFNKVSTAISKNKTD
jgi:hypothetical protein